MANQLRTLLLQKHFQVTSEGGHAPKWICSMTFTFAFFCSSASQHSLTHVLKSPGIILALESLRLKANSNIFSYYGIAAPGGA